MKFKRAVFFFLIICILVALAGVWHVFQNDGKETNINGIMVPPEPSPDLSNATVAGVDSNSNGVRDDVERLIALRYGDSPEKMALTTKVAKAMQAMFISPSVETHSAYSNTMRCVFDNAVLTDAIVIERAMLSTGARKGIYGELTAGSAIDEEGCEQAGNGQSISIDNEIINGIVVPPEPSPELNNSTLAGIDVNGNGVRDDVERLIARTFGADQNKFAEAMSFSRAEQRTIVSPSKDATAAYALEVDCTLMSADQLDPITFALANTGERKVAFRNANAGMTLTVGRVCN